MRPMKSAAARAQEILRMYWDGGVPVEPLTIAQRLGAKVIPDVLLETEELSGKFGYEDNIPVIRYNPSDIPVRRRFTLAHELGHFVLGHKGAFRDPKQFFSAENYEPMEAAANRFAAELLMPKLAIQHYILERKTHDVRALASKFLVSPVAMRYRLENLGWLNQ